jgi:hypothetical protein
MNMGIVACCTGVVFTKPIASTASMIHSDRAGVKALNARSTFVWGAMRYGVCMQLVRRDSVKRDGTERRAPNFCSDKKKLTRALIGQLHYACSQRHVHSTARVHRHMHCLIDVQEPTPLFYIDNHLKCYFIFRHILNLASVFTCKLTSLPSRVCITGTQSTHSHECIYPNIKITCLVTRAKRS